MSARSWAVNVTAGALAVTGQILVQPPSAPAAALADAAAAATQTWGPVTRLGWSPWGESLVVDAANNTAVVSTTRSWPPAVVVRRHPDGGSWGDPVVVGHGYAPQVAADARGNLTVVWLTRRQGFTDGVVAVRRPVGGRWSDPVRLSHDLRVPGYPQGGEEAYGADDVDLAVSPRGAAVVAWAWGSDGRDKPWRIQSAYRPPRGAWREPVDVTPASEARAPQVGIDLHGIATVAYGRQLFGHPQVLKVRRRVPGDGWTRPAVVAPEGYDYSLGVDRAGDAVVVFSPDFRAVQAVSRPADGRWGPARALSPAGVAVNDFALAMNGRGVTVVALGRSNGRVDLVQRPADGPWSAPVPVALDGSVVSDVLVALNGAGDLFLGWGTYALYGQYLPHGGDWSGPFTISPDAGVEVLESTHAQVAPDGDVAVLWKQEERRLKVRLMAAS
jgi:hypothetical protein